MKRSGKIDLIRLLDALCEQREAHAKLDARIAKRDPSSPVAAAAARESALLLQNARNARDAAQGLIDAVRITCNAAPSLRSLSRMRADREVLIRYVAEDLRQICGALARVQPDGHWS